MFYGELRATPNHRLPNHFTSSILRNCIFISQIHHFVDSCKTKHSNHQTNKKRKSKKKLKKEIFFFEKEVIKILDKTAFNKQS